MKLNSEKLARKLAELRGRNQTRKSEGILSGQKGAVLQRFVGGAILEKANEFWRLFSDSDYKPFSTLPDTVGSVRFKEWVTDCYQKAGSFNAVFVSIGSLDRAELAEVEIHFVAEWVQGLKNYLASNSMSFDILLINTSADAALELWEDEYHYSAFLSLPNTTAKK